MSTIVFDTAALTDFAKNKALRAMVNKLVQDEAWRVDIPVAILAEAISGKPQHDVTTHRTLNNFGHEPLDYDSAKHAGTLRGRLAGGRALPSGIDAIVVAHAELCGDTATVITSDVDDLKRLADVCHKRVGVRGLP